MQILYYTNHHPVSLRQPSFFIKICNVINWPFDFQWRCSSTCIAGMSSVRTGNSRGNRCQSKHAVKQMMVRNKKLSYRRETVRQLRMSI